MNMSGYQKGISLIEVLITALILGVGLLGVAAMQITSINSNQSGYYRSQATTIAEDISSRIRAASLATYNGTTTLANVITRYSGAPYACDAAPTSCTGAACSAAELAEYDIWEVCTSAENELPDGQVFVVNSAGIRSQIAVVWTPVAARTDLGQQVIVNSSCSDVSNTIGSDKDCIILEIIP